MKKIIATVLAMVMALALCTTAFAATTETKVDKTGYTLMDLTNKEITITADEFTKTVTDAKVVTSGSKTTTTYYADKYEINSATYYACDAAIATHKLVKGGTVVFLIDASTTTAKFADGTTKVATAFVEAKDAADRKCGDVESDAYVIEGKNYVTTGTNLAVLNGKFVTYGGEATTVGHKFTKAAGKTSGYFTTDTKGVVNTVKCENCDKFFNVVKTVDKNYTGSVEPISIDNVTMYVLTGTATATPAGSTGTTTSPKTFDAGIAMYVGMALTSVAGSAVVIGKKKEF